MLKVVKVRLYPNSQQQEALSQSFGNCRWLWNYCLNLMNETYKQTGKGLSGYAVKKQIPQLKKEYEWLKLTYSQCLQQACLNLGVAFNNFFERRARYPRFKSKHAKQSIQYPQNVKRIIASSDSPSEGSRCAPAHDSLRLPMIGDVKAVFHREIEGIIKTVTVSRNKAGQYHAAILSDNGQDKPDQRSVLKDTAPLNQGDSVRRMYSLRIAHNGKTIGLDLGLTHFCITSDGSKFDNPRWLKKHEKNLKVKQQQLSRKQKGSNNKNKSRVKVAKVHLKIANCRSDFHHKLSRRIVDENQVICVENLAVANMVKNYKLAKAIQQVGWGQFCTMLKYKAEQEGRIYQEVDRFFPSSKIHNTCLYQIDSLPLDIRFWDCPNCGTKHIDRDTNAASNIRDEGLRILNSTSGTGDKAYRQTVRRSSRGRKKSTTTQVLG